MDDVGESYGLDMDIVDIAILGIPPKRHVAVHAAAKYAR